MKKMVTVTVFRKMVTVTVFPQNTSPRWNADGNTVTVTIFLTRILPFGCALLLAPAEAAVFHKCIAADGAVTYSDEPCPRGTRTERIEIESTGQALPPLPSVIAPEAFLPAAPAAEASPTAAPAATPAHRPSLARQCGEARADSNWFYMQDAARMDASTRRALEREEAERQRFIEEHCR